MRKPDLSRILQAFALAAGLAITTAMLPRVVAAQTPATDTSITRQPMTDRDDDDDDQDWGWLGLLGLAGLLGLRRRYDADRTDRIDTTRRT
jgi:MYXO-CTERM domain-containing protein